MDQMQKERVLARRKMKIAMMAYERITKALSDHPNNAVLEQRFKSIAATLNICAARCKAVCPEFPPWTPVPEVPGVAKIIVS